MLFMFTHFGRVFNSLLRGRGQGQNLFLSKRCPITILISWYQIHVKRTKILEVIPVLVLFGRVFNPLLRGCGHSRNFFLRKRCTIAIPISWYQICVKRTKILEVIPVLVIFGRVFNPLQRGCGRGKNFFLEKRCTTTIPISWYQIYVKQTKTWEVISVLVIFGRVFNPLLRGCGRGQNFFLSKRHRQPIRI